MNRRQMLAAAVALPAGMASLPLAAVAAAAWPAAADSATAEAVSRRAAAALRIPPTVGFLRVAGYARPGDGGQAVYARAALPVAAPGRFRSADGAWWEYLPEPGGFVDPLAFGATTDGRLCTTRMQEAVDLAAGRPIRLPDGCILTGPLTGGATDRIRLHGTGAGSELRLGSATAVGTETLLEFHEITLRGPLTLHDSGRPGMDHTTYNAAYLCKATTRWDVDGTVAFVTDRAVVLQEARVDDPAGYARMTGNVSVSRVTPPVHGETEATSEADQVNVFVLDGVRRIEIDGLRADEIMARSLLSCIFRQTTATQYGATCSIRRLTIDLFQCNGRDVADKEVKCVFVQGYQASLQHLSFTDAFGRYVDVLGNEHDGSAQGNFYPSEVRHVRGSYTDARRATAAGRANDEAGAIYCRFPGAVTIEDVELDFSNLTGLPRSNIYSGIAVRHGSRHVAIRHVTVIAPLAHAIQVDISDAVTDDHRTVLDIEDVTIRGAGNAGRKPIRVQVDSAAKKFERVSIRDVDCDYAAAGTFIEFSLGTGFARTEPFGARYVLLDGCVESNTGSLDAVDMQVFPERLDSPATAVAVSVDPGGPIRPGVLPDLGAALGLAQGYRCDTLLVRLDPSVTAARTLPAPVALGEVMPRVTTIEGDNGAGGRIRFRADGAQQAGVSMTLRGNEIVFDGCRHESDAAGNTASLILAFGSGIFRAVNCAFLNGEHAIDTRGPDYAIRGGSIDNIAFGNPATNAIVRVDADRPVRGSIQNVTGAGNHRLYNHVSPAVLVHSGAMPEVSAAPLGSVSNAVMDGKRAD